jgi:DNA-binding transcriptional LysR family regulator
MDIRHLVTFRVLAKTRSFTKTAMALDYVQSNVTAHIQALEKELGVRLVDRLGKHVALTEAGACLLPYAEQVVALVEEAQARVSGFQEPRGQVRIGAPESICSYRLAPLLQEMHHCFPLTRPIFAPGPVKTLMQRVREGTIDVAFVLDELLWESDLAIRQLRPEPILVLCGRDHPLAARQSIHAKDINGMTMLATEMGCAYRAAFEQALTNEGSHVGDLLEFSSVEAIKQCVIAGMGFTVLPQMAVQREVEELQLVPLLWEGPSLTMQFQLVWRQKRWLSPAVQAFIDTAQTYQWT